MPPRPSSTVAARIVIVCAPARARVAKKSAVNRMAHPLPDGRGSEAVLYGTARVSKRACGANNNVAMLEPNLKAELKLPRSLRHGDGCKRAAVHGLIRRV